MSRKRRGGRPDGWTPASKRSRSPETYAKSKPPRGQAHEADEWRRAVASMTEWERAPFDDPVVYADLQT
jgi:hypothetical protein